MPRALVIGAGVAGPATALFLSRAGWDVQLFDSEETPNPYAGLFLNVATNGLRVLDQLGLRDRLVSDGHRASRMVMLNGSGRVLGTVSNGPANDPDRGGVIVRRAWLHEVLRDGAIDGRIPLHRGARLVGISEQASRVQAEFADGRIAHGDILVGADGIGSFTRSWIDATAPAPTYRGLLGTGGFARVPGLSPSPDAQYFVFGARSFFGYLVRHDGTVYWFANLTRPQPGRADTHRTTPALLSELRALHAADPHPLPQILAATGAVSGYPIYDLAGVRAWSRGRVVAVGDAVHATSPSTGQGASQALEDAITLAKCLRDLPDHHAAFARYQNARRPRTEAIRNYARRVDGQKKVTTTRMGIAIRDALMPLFLRRAAGSTRNDWLYDHRIDWDDRTRPRDHGR